MVRQPYRERYAGVEAVNEFQQTFTVGTRHSLTTLYITSRSAQVPKKREFAAYKAVVPAFAFLILHIWHACETRA
jgi:hypothetical protein